MSQQTRAVSPRLLAGAAGAVALVFVLLVGGWLLGTHVRFVGSNSVAPRYPIAGITPGHRLCARKLVLPGNANAMHIWLTGSTVPAPVTLRLTAGGRTQVAWAEAPAGGFDTVFHFAAVGQRVRRSPPAKVGTLLEQLNAKTCVSQRDGGGQARQAAADYQDALRGHHPSTNRPSSPPGLL